MRQQLAVAHRDLGVGALHLEGEGVGVALYGGQLEVLQQVDAGLHAAGSLHGAASGVPQSLQSAYAPARVGRYLYRYGGAFGSLCHLRFCYVELHGTLSVRAHLEVVGRSDARHRLIYFMGSWVEVYGQGVGASLGDIDNAVNIRICLIPAVILHDLVLHICIEIDVGVGDAVGAVTVLRHVIGGVSRIPNRAKHG